MITVSKIIDHASLALARLASQFRDKTKVQGLLTAVSNEVQAVEDAFWDLYLQQRDVTAATGQQLDNLGDLVGAPVRGLRTDVQLMARIVAQIAINKSTGDSADIYAIAKNLVTTWNVAGQPRIGEQPTSGQYTIGCKKGTTIPLAPSVALTGSLPGGSLAAGTYFYRFTGVDGLGRESLPTTEVSITISASHLARALVAQGVNAPLAQVRMYGRTTGAEQLIVSGNVTSSGTLILQDDGSHTPSGAMPTTSTAGYDVDDSLTNDDAQTRELAQVLNTASSGGVRAIVKSRPSSVSGGTFFRFAGGSGAARGFDVGSLVGAYDK